MNIQPELTIQARRVSTGRRVVSLLLVYAIASASVIVVLLLQMRADAIVSGEKLASAFAQLASDQTAQIVSGVERTLRNAETSLSAATGTSSEGSIRAAFRDLLRDRPYLTAIKVLDEQGRIVHDSDVGEIGMDLSNRPYFVDQRDRPGSGFDLGAPFRSPSTGQWFIPATLTLRRANGDISGVVVGTVEPLHFQHAWTLDDQIPGLDIALLRGDGTMLMRAPLGRGTSATVSADGRLGERLRAGLDSGVLQAVRASDQEWRLIAYRRLAAFPNLVIVVGQSMDVVLAGWWRLVWMVAAGWALGSAALGGLVLWLAHEWKTRHAVEERNRDLFERSPHPTYAVNRETLRFVAVNDAAVEQYGWSREEFLAMTSNDLYLPEDVPAVIAQRKEALLDVARTIHGRRHRKKDGTVIDVEMNVRLFELDGQLTFLAIVQDVTEKIQADIRRIAAEKRLRAIMDNTIDGLITIDQTGRILSINGAAEIIFGYREAEVVGQNVRMFMPEPVRSRHDGYLASYIATGRARVIGIGREVVGVRRDGTEFPMDLSVNEFSDMAGQRHFVGTVRDITQKKAAEDQLRTSQAHYRLLFDANPYATTVTDRETMRIVAANLAAEALYGWSQEEMLAMTADDFYLPEDVPAITARRREYPPNATSMVSGLRHRKKDGSAIDVEMAARIIDYNGRPANLTIVTDTSERLRTERARQAAEDRNRLLFEASPYPISLSDRESLRILAVSDEAVHLQGWSREEFLTMTVADLYPPEDRPAAALRRKEFTARETQIVRGLRYCRKDGTIFDVEIAVRLIDYNGRPATLAMVMDVTERLRAERERRAAEEQLRQSQKMEVVGQLTGGIAHDFNNILTVILANADSLQDEEGLAPGVVDRLDRIAKAVLRASDLTRSLLAFSRKQPLSPKSTVLNDLVSGIGNLLRRTLGEHIELDAILADDLWTVDIDRAQFESALVNLCVNARDAMPAGGRLLIETRNVTFDGQYVSQNPGAAAGDYVQVAISDTGSGMPPEVLAKVFEPFFTTKEVGKGTGLGLSMVYGFVTQSGGSIKVESEVGRGTSFEFLLPRGKEAQATEGTGEEVGIPRGTERILVVEDEPDVRFSVALHLKSLGYAVTDAPDGTAGVAVLEAASRPFDLLLTDIVMPGPLNGKALADEAARRWPTTKIVFMSGYTNEALTQSGRLDAGVLLLSKPFRKADLAKIVRQALDGEGSPDRRPAPSA